MRKFRFKVILLQVSDISEEIANALFAAGCDDGSPGSCDGVVSIDFHREAESLELAIRSAAQNVRSAGFQIDHVELAADTVLQ